MLPLRVDIRMSLTLILNHRTLRRHCRSRDDKHLTPALNLYEN